MKIILVRRGLLKLLGLTLTLVSCAPATAQTVIGNYPPSNDDTSSTIAASGGQFSKGAGFTLPAGTDYQLNFAKVRLQVNDLAANASFALYADSFGVPGGAPLVDFVIPTFSSTAVMDYVLTPSSSFQMNAGATYWLVGSGSSPSPDGITWLASSPGITPTGIATSAGYRFTNSGGLPTSSSSIANTYLIDASATSGAAVPEPGSLALFGPGLAVLLLLRKRRKRAQ